MTSPDGAEPPLFTGRSLQCPPAGLPCGAWKPEWLCSLREGNCPSGGCRLMLRVGCQGVMSRSRTRVCDPEATGPGSHQALKLGPVLPRQCSGQTHRPPAAQACVPQLWLSPVLPPSFLGLGPSLGPSPPGSPLRLQPWSPAPCCPPEWRSLEAPTVPVDLD